MFVHAIIRNLLCSVEQVQDRPSKIYEGSETLRDSLFFTKLKAHALKAWKFVTATPGRSKSAVLVMVSNIDYPNPLVQCSQLLSKPSKYMPGENKTDLVSTERRICKYNL